MCEQIAKEITREARILEIFFVLFANLSIFSFQFSSTNPYNIERHLYVT
jgi:hypothetical protein